MGAIVKRINEADFSCCATDRNIYLIGILLCVLVTGAAFIGLITPVWYLPVIICVSGALDLVRSLL